MKRSVALAALVAFDLGTKAVAHAMLAPGVWVREDELFQFVLNVNTGRLGTWAVQAAANATARQLAIGGISAAALGVYIALTRSLSLRSWSLFRKVIAGIAVWIVGRLAGAVAIVALGGATWTAGIVLTRVGGAAFFSGLWWTAETRLWQATTRLFAAAALGNLLCLLYPPHAIVDFMYSVILKETFRQEIFNFADLYFDIALVCLVLTFAKWVAIRVKSSASASGA